MLAPEFLPIWGGVGSYVVELTRHLPSSFDIHVVAPQRERLGNSDVRTEDYNLNNYFWKNVTVHYISRAKDTFFYNGSFQLACMRVVPSIVKDAGIDLIHSHAAHMPDLLLAYRRMNVPILTTVHTTIYGQRHGARESGSSFRDLEFSEKATLLGYPFLRLAEDAYFSFPRHYMTPSNWMRDQLLRLRSNLKSRITVIHNSVDIGEFKTRTHEERIVLFTGRFVAAKGITVIVNAIPRILSEHPETRFLFVGPGNSKPYEDRLKKLNIRSDRYEFLGFLKDRESIVNCYQSCSVYVAPTLYENMPIRILEAMSCGKPVVATNVGAIPEAITHGKNGLIVQPGDVIGIARSINKLLDDGNLRRQVGAAARQTVEREFNWDKNIRKIVALYEALLN